MCPAGREQGLSYSAGAGWGTGPALPTGPEREHLPAGRPGREGALESAGRGCSSQGSPAQGHRAQGRPGATRTKEAASNPTSEDTNGGRKAVGGDRGKRAADSGRVGALWPRVRTPGGPGPALLPPTLAGSAPPLFLQFRQSDFRACRFTGTSEGGSGRWGGVGGTEGEGAQERRGHLEKERSVWH